MLKTLLKDQKIRIDAHQWGAGERVTWDKPANDIHIDKITNWRVKGKQLQVRIRIPINSQRPISIEIPGNVKNKDKVLQAAERQLVQEITSALSDPLARQAFIDDLLAIIENYPSSLSSVDRAKSVIRQLSRHFGLRQETARELIGYVEGKIQFVMSVYPAPTGNYFLRITNDGLELGQIETNLIRFENNRRRNRK